MCCRSDLKAQGLEKDLEQARQQIHDDRAAYVKEKLQLQTAHAQEGDHSTEVSITSANHMREQHAAEVSNPFTFTSALRLSSCRSCRIRQCSSEMMQSILSRSTWHLSAHLRTVLLASEKTRQTSRCPSLILPSVPVAGDRQPLLSITDHQPRAVQLSVVCSRPASAPYTIPLAASCLVSHELVSLSQQHLSKQHLL